MMSLQRPKKFWRKWGRQAALGRGGGGRHQQKGLCGFLLWPGRPKAQGPSDAPRLTLQPPLRTAKEEIRDIVVQEGTFLQGSYFKTI